MERTYGFHHSDAHQLSRAEKNTHGDLDKSKCPPRPGFRDASATSAIERDAGGSGGQDHSWLHSESAVSEKN